MMHYVSITIKYMIMNVLSLLLHLCELIGPLNSLISSLLTYTEQAVWTLLHDCLPSAPHSGPPAVCLQFPAVLNKKTIQNVNRIGSQNDNLLQF